MQHLRSRLWSYLRSGPALNLWAGYFCFGSTALYGILSLPLAVRFLDKEQLGLWNLVTQVVGYLLWLELGVSTMTGRTLAEPIQSGNQESIDRTWSSILMILGAQAVVMIALGFSGLPFFLDFFGIPSGLRDDAAFVFGGTVLISTLALPLRATPGVFLCQDRLHWSMIIQGSMPWVNLLVFWIMLEAGQGVRSFVFSTALVNIVQFFWLRALLECGGRKLRFRPRLVSASSVKPILGFSSSMMLWSIAPAAIASIPAVVIGRQLGLDQVSIYNVTSRVPVMLASVALRTYHSFYPRIQKHFVAGEHARFVALFRVSTWLSVWASGATLAIGVLANSWVVGFLARPDFYGGFLLTLLMATGLLTMAVAEHVGTLFYCAGKSKLVSPVLALEVVITFAIAVFLCSRYGLPGVAAAIAFMPTLIRLPYFISRGPSACGSKFMTLYQPALSGVASVLLCGWGASLIAVNMATTIFALVGIGMVLTGSLFGIISLRQGWRSFKDYQNR